jgi:phage terminase small subunit
MDKILASQASSHWRSGDEFLVEQYAQSILAAREAYAHLETEGYVLANGRSNPWLVPWEKATRASVALAARLRLSPQQETRC